MMCSGGRGRRLICKNSARLEITQNMPLYLSVRGLGESIHVLLSQKVYEKN